MKVIPYKAYPAMVSSCKIQISRHSFQEEEETSQLSFAKKEALAKKLLFWGGHNSSLQDTPSGSKDKGCVIISIQKTKI